MSIELCWKSLQIRIIQCYCAPRCFADFVGYTFLFQIVDDGIGAKSILQLINKYLYFGRPLFVLVDGFLCHSMNSEIDMKRVLLSYNIVFAAVSRSFLNTVVITLVPLLAAVS